MSKPKKKLEYEYLEYVKGNDNQLIVHKKYDPNRYFRMAAQLASALQDKTDYEKTYLQHHYKYVDNFQKYAITPAYRQEKAQRQISFAHNIQRQKRKIEEFEDEKSMFCQYNNITGTTFKPRMLTSSYKQRRNTSNQRPASDMEFLRQSMVSQYGQERMNNSLDLSISSLEYNKL